METSSEDFRGRDIVLVLVLGDGSKGICFVIIHWAVHLYVHIFCVCCITIKTF